ncbi:MAG: protein kinase [Polyangiaceae bacterium]|nr:protein kinase [Polyangiaceae bacterium]
MTFHPGNTIGRYELLYLAGRGGMGDVWCARSVGKHGFSRLVAVKTLTCELSEDPALREMFREEARLAASIEHENVARVVDAGEHAGVPYLVMEWVAGESLGKLLRFLRDVRGDASLAPSALVPLPVLLRVVADACAGLHAVHEVGHQHAELQGLVHRDVSPANVMVSVTGSAKVIDFGIAKRQAAAVHTRAGVLKGTIRFMSPEQVEGDDVDRRADVWAMGVVLYHLLTGRYPHRADAEAQILVGLSLGHQLEPLPSDVPEPLRRVVERALTWDRAARTPTAQALRREILAAMDVCNLHATVDDVAAFLRTSLAERFAAHRAAVEDADRFAEEMPTRWGPSVGLLSAPAPSEGAEATALLRAPLPLAEGHTARVLRPTLAATRARRDAPGPKRLPRLSWAAFALAVGAAAAAGLGVALLPTPSPVALLEQAPLTAVAPLRTRRSEAEVVTFAALPAAPVPSPVFVPRARDAAPRPASGAPSLSLERAMERR